MSDGKETRNVINLEWEEMNRHLEDDQRSDIL